jgi:cAMP-binding proteins - catabolite gene activator and regulatory subunit of cAMP-dependent protein kinases
MNLGQRLVDLTTASPFTGAGMSLVTALVALAILVFLRRMLPPENRDHGGVLKIFLAVGALLAFTRLGLLTLGVGHLAMGRLLTMLSTFFVAMGVIGTAVMGVFEILPSRANINSTLASLSAGDFIGEMSLMTGEPRAATCLAATDVLSYELDHATLQSVLTTRPAIADQMSALLAARQVDLARKGGEISAQAAARTTEHRRALGEKIRRLFNLS